jgi:hypothetical protein
MRNPSQQDLLTPSCSLSHQGVLGTPLHNLVTPAQVCCPLCSNSSAVVQVKVPHQKQQLVAVLWSKRTWQVSWTSGQHGGLLLYSLSCPFRKLLKHPTTPTTAVPLPHAHHG